MKEERTLIIIKPDALQRNLLGEIIHKDKPFFESLKRYMQSSPVAVAVLSGYNAMKMNFLHTKRLTLNLFMAKTSVNLDF